MELLDLKVMFGRRFKLGVDPSYHAERPDLRHDARPWLRTILCQHGEIIPWGNSTLAAVTAKAGTVARRLKALPNIEVWQDGSDGVTVLFDAADFDQIADIMRPRRRRHLTPEARAAAGERLRKYQFGHAVGLTSDTQFCVPAGSVDV